MTTKNSKQKYSPEDTLSILDTWGFSTDTGVSTTGITIHELGAKFGNRWNPAELRAKLSHEGRYKAKPKTKSGKAPVRKGALATILGTLCDMSEPDASSLEKSNKTALEKVITTIEALNSALTFYESEAEEEEEGGVDTSENETGDFSDDEETAIPLAG